MFQQGMFSCDVVSIILGGGEGRRLFPLTKNRSKPAVPLGGKYRLVDIPVSNCLNSGFQRIFVLTQYNSASLNRHIMQSFSFDHLTQGFVEVLAAEIRQDNYEWYQGTADAVRQNLMHFRVHSPKYCLILAGDQLYRMDFRKIFAQHIKTKADITVATVLVGSDEAPGLGVPSIDEEKRIRAFYEKPHDPRIIDSLALNDDFMKRNKLSTGNRKHIGSMGIYVFNMEVLEEILRDQRMIDFGKDVIPSSLIKFDVRAYLFDGYWQDIGTIKSFFEANINLTRPEPSFDFYHPHSSIYTRPRLLPPSKIQDCEIKDSNVAEGSLISGVSINDSIIGIRSIIMEDTKIERSVLMGNDYYSSESRSRIPLGIGTRCVIRNAIIDKNAQIGNNVKIINKNSYLNYDGNGYCIREGIIIVEKNAQIKSGTVI